MLFGPRGISDEAEEELLIITEVGRGRGQIAAASLHPTLHMAYRVFVCRTMIA
jgi:hypothetical protein